MNSNTQKVASVGFIGLAIFSAVVLFFPLAYQILPEVLQESKPFTLAYSLVSVCWMMATAATAIKSTVDADSKAWREYYDSLPESGDGDDGDDDEGDGDDEDEEGGEGEGEDEDEGDGEGDGNSDDVGVEWERWECDGENWKLTKPGTATWKEPESGAIRTTNAVPATTDESANSLDTPDSGFVRADEIKPNPHQAGIQVFRVPGGTLKPGM